MFDKDRMTNIKLKDITKLAYTLVDVMQGRLPEAQILAPSLLMILLASKLKISPNEVLQIADNIVKHGKQTNNEHVLAFIAYIEGELK